MGFSATRAILALAVGALVGGCANVPREAGFRDVESTVAERTGQRVHWNQGSAADDDVAEVTRSMLNKELTADEAVQIALLNNRQLQAVYEDLMIAQADLVEAGLLSNPVFDAEFRFLDDGTAVEMSIVQDFLEILYLPLRKRVAEAQFEATKLRVAGAVIDLAGETRLAFYELQGSQQTLEMRRQVRQATESSYDLAQRMRRAGNITELELVNEQALYEQSKVSLAAAEAQVALDRERLNELMGTWGDAVGWQTAVRLPEPVQQPALQEGVERRAVAQSLDLGAARLEIEAAGRRLGIVRPFAALPSVEAGASAEREPGGEWGLGPALAFPVPLFNQGQPAVARAQAEYRRAWQEYAALAVAVRARVRAAMTAVESARQRAEYYRRVILPVRQRIVQQTQLQYNAMQVGPFELLVAKRDQIDAAAEYIETLEGYWRSKTQLDQILAGRLASLEQSSNRSTGGEDERGMSAGESSERTLHRD